MTEINPSKGSQSDFQAQFKNQLEESEPAPLGGPTLSNIECFQESYKQTIQQYCPYMPQEQVKKLAESLAKTLQDHLNKNEL
jgi:predicted Zn-dependent protease